MTELKLARTGYLDRSLVVGPLWRYVGRDFMRSLEEDEESEDFWRFLYEGAREKSEAAVDEESLVATWLEQPGSPLVLVGPGGVGKSTLLKSAMRQVRARKELAIFRVDILRDFLDPFQTSGTESGAAPEPPVTLALRTVQKRIGDFMRRQGVERDYVRFVVAHASDPDCVRLELRTALQPGGSATEDDVLAAFRTIPVEERVRVALAYVRRVLRRRPVVVLDNWDQQPQSVQREIVDVARRLSAGPSLASDGADDVVSDMRAATTVCVRPETLTRLRRVDQLSTSATIRLARVMPPDIEGVVTRRLKHFFENWGGRIGGGTRDGEERRAVALAGEAVPEVLDRDTVVRTIEAMNSLLFERQITSALVSRVRALANHSTRTVLMALCQFVASGHHDWKALLGTARRTDSTREEVTRGRVGQAFRALLLGIQPHYDPAHCWALNLLNDGVAADEYSALTRSWALLYFERAGASLVTPLHEAANELGSLFGMPSARMSRVLIELSELGLLEEISGMTLSSILPRDSGGASPAGAHGAGLAVGSIGGSAGLRISNTGLAYLRELDDFDYLQMMVVDAYVDPPRCRKLKGLEEEDARTKVERLVAFAEYLREIETARLESIKGRGQLAGYAAFMGRDTISARIARCVDGFAQGTSAARRQNWEEILERIRVLRRENPAGMPSEAQPRSRGERPR